MRSVLPRSTFHWFAIPAFCLWIFAFSFEALTASQQIPEESHHTWFEDTKNFPDVGRAIDDQPHLAKQATKRKQKQEKAAEYAIEFFNIKLSDALIAVFTIVLAVKTSGLFKETARLRAAADQQAADMKASIAEAKRAADASNRSAQIAEDTLIKLQRAFVSFAGIRYLSHVPGDGDGDGGGVWWSLHFRWVNSGSSPARKVRLYVDRYFEDVDMPKDYPFDASKVESAIIMGPKSEAVNAFGALTAEELMAVREKKKFLYYWGRADYQDIFDNTPDRVTKFAVQVLDFRGNPASPWDDKFNIVELILNASPPKHNCADEDCNHDC